MQAVEIIAKTGLSSNWVALGMCSVGAGPQVWHYTPLLPAGDGTQSGVLRGELWTKEPGVEEHDDADGRMEGVERSTCAERLEKNNKGEGSGGTSAKNAQAHQATSKGAL